MLLLEFSDLIFTFWKNLQADSPSTLTINVCNAKISQTFFTTILELYYGFISALLARKTQNNISKTAVLILIRFFITNLVKFALPFDPYYWVLKTVPLQTLVFLRSNALKKISTFIFHTPN